ncbi:MAG TPA: endonuclease [Ferruginibacter sp.]|nr:endonuclease [Ferruginibacter sp.]HPH89290.1 endonuclease [Ferruginibacter sp.]
MYKLLLAAILIISTTVSSAQIPVGYYDSAYVGAVPKTCAALKTALFGIVSKDTNYVAYNSADGSYDTQNGVNNFDRRRNDDNTADIIWDMYTDNPTGPELYTFTPEVDQCGGSFPPEVGACYNREHAYPRAWFGDDFHIRGDLHNVYATDGESNSRHANFPYAEVGFASWTSPAGAKLGNSSFPGYNGTVFEMIDEYKGDFARTMFFMVTAYENFMPAWKNLSTADSALDGTTWPSLDNWAIRQWYKWHVQDPVSQKEITRNDSVFSVQGNRNPFIDHPEYVQLIWSCTGVLPVALIDFTAVKNDEGVLLQWKAGAETNLKQYEVERSIDGVSFTKTGIVIAQNKAIYNLTDINLPDVRSVFYRLKMMDNDGRFVYSKTVNVKLNRRNTDIRIYPNPAVNEIAVSLAQASMPNSVVKITDITGKEVLMQKTAVGQTTIRLKISNLPAGRYFVSVINNETALYDSFLIVR